jgi:hypothetical protein
MNYKVLHFAIYSHDSIEEHRCVVYADEHKIYVMKEEEFFDKFHVVESIAYDKANNVYIPEYMLEEINIESIKSYLLAKDWIFRESKGVLIFKKLNSLDNIIIPVDKNVDDYFYAIRIALNRMAMHENRDMYTVFHDIVNL